MTLEELFEKHPRPWKENKYGYVIDANKNPVPWDVAIHHVLALMNCDTLTELRRQVSVLRKQVRSLRSMNMLCPDCRGKGYERGGCLKCELDKLHLLIDRYIGFNVDTTKLKEEASATMRSYLERRLS